MRCSVDVLCGRTCAVLLSLIKASSCSQLTLMNSFSTGLSSWTMNSFLVTSIPRSSERMSWSMPSSDTGREMEPAEITVTPNLNHKHVVCVCVCVCTYRGLPCPQSAGRCRNWPSRGIFPGWCWWWTEAASVSGLSTWSPAAEKQRRCWMQCNSSTCNKHQISPSIRNVYLKSVRL